MPAPLPLPVAAVDGVGLAAGPPVQQALEHIAAASEEQQLRRGRRQRQSSVWLRDYVTHTIQKMSPSQKSPSPQHCSGTPYPIAH